MKASQENGLAAEIFSPNTMFQYKQTTPIQFQSGALGVY